MENKYYTPTIEEFHIGFEYETYELYETPNRWKINIFGEEHMELDYIVFLLMEHPDMIRVKYLDKEDIESLGFTQSNLNEEIFLKEVNKYNLLNNVTIGLNYRKEFNHLFVFYVPDQKARPAGVNIFIGYIKNKSELKVLLKQLGIE